MIRRIAAILIAGALPMSIQAQTTTVVRVPESVATKFHADAVCTAKTRTFTGAPGDQSVDTLIVQLQNDQNRPAKAPATLAVRVAGLLSDSVRKDETSRSLPAPSLRVLQGKAVTITRGEALVCSVVVPPEESLDDSTTAIQRSFRVGIGATFDFLSGVSASDLYSDLTIFQPNMWDTKVGIFGVDGGIYNGRAAARRDTTGNVLRTIYRPREARDSLTRITQVTSRRHHVTHEELGLYLSPTHRITKDLFLTLHSEVVKRNVITETAITVDSSLVEVVRDTFSARLPIPSPLAPVPGDTTITRRTTEYETFYGLGPILSAQFGTINLRAKTVVGLGVVRGVWTRRYFVQFRLTDFDNGFKMGGDIRGNLSLDQPTILVYLSRDYSFKRLANFLVGKESDQ